jgi:hypothetical protein
MIHRFEHRTEPLLATQAFVRCVMVSFLFGIGMIVFSLTAGMAGYHFFEQLS